MTRRRYELTDREWSIIAPLLPNKPRGVPRVDDRRVLNGILWRFQTGSPWAEIPERYGPPTTCYNRFVRWRKAGVWDRLLEAVSEAYDGDIVMIDSSCVRVHQHAATKKRGSGRWRHGTFPRRSHQQDPCARRRRGPPCHTAPDRRPGCRLQGIRSTARRPRRGRHPARRQGLRQRRHPRQGGRAQGLGKHPAQGKPQGHFPLLRLALSPTQPRGAVLQPHQTLPRHCHTTTRTRRTTSPPSSSSQPASGACHNEPTA